jgi:hypothetical protein
MLTNFSCNTSIACFIHLVQVSRVIRAYEAIKRAEMSGTQPPNISHKNNSSNNNHDAASWSAGHYIDDNDEQQHDEQVAVDQEYNSAMPIQPSSALLQEVESWGLFGGAVSLLQQPAVSVKQQQQQQFSISSEAAHRAAATAATSLLDVRPRLGARLGTAASRPGTACSTTTLHEFDEEDMHNADDDLSTVMQPGQTADVNNNAVIASAHNEVDEHMNTNSSDEQALTVTTEAVASPARESVQSFTTAVQELSPAVVQRSTAAAAPATVTRMLAATADAAAAIAAVNKGLDVTPGDRLASAAAFDTGMSPAASLQASQRGGSSGGRSVRSVLSDKQCSSGRRIAFEVCSDESGKDGLELTAVATMKATATTTATADAVVQLSAGALASPVRSSAAVVTATTSTTTAVTMITKSAAPDRAAGTDQEMTAQCDVDLANELPLSADISAVVQSMSAKKRARSPESTVITASKKRATATASSTARMPVPRVAAAVKPRPEWSIMSYSGDVLATSDGVPHSKDSCDMCDCCSEAVERCTVNDSVSAVRWFETINACLIAASD